MDSRDATRCCFNNETAIYSIYCDNTTVGFPCVMKVCSSCCLVTVSSFVCHLFCCHTRWLAKTKVLPYDRSKKSLQQPQSHQLCLSTPPCHFLCHPFSTDYSCMSEGNTKDDSLYSDLLLIYCCWTKKNNGTLFARKVDHQIFTTTSRHFCCFQFNSLVLPLQTVTASLWRSGSVYLSDSGGMSDAGSCCPWILWGSCTCTGCSPSPRRLLRSKRQQGRNEAFWTAWHDDMCKNLK